MTQTLMFGTEVFTRRQYLLTKALRSGTPMIVAMEAVSAIALAHPGLDMKEERTWSQWECS